MLKWLGYIAQTHLAKGRYIMYVSNKSKRLLIIGIIGCILYVIGDFLFAATGRGQTTESIGFMVRVAYLEMGTWRMVGSILCGFVGTLLYYMGFHRMYSGQPALVRHPDAGGRPL